jgi:hypothetical protein
MSGDECRLADWRTIGYEDGARGAPAEALGPRREACADHGVAPDLDAYRRGRDEGLREFCRPERGFALGDRGGRYVGVCPSELEPDFVDAWRAGSRLHELRGFLARADGRVVSLEQERENLKTRRRELEAELIAVETTLERRALIVAELRTHGDDVAEVAADLDDARAERAYQQENLSDYRAYLAGLGW